MRIAEIYPSKQGEGRLTGVESVFVRASGCNLRCWFCDTPFASWEPEGDAFGIDQIVAEVVRSRLRHVVITGGEPMIFDDLVPLCETLHSQGQHITIETAGTVFRPVRCDLMSISPKMSNSTPPEGTSSGWHHRHEQVRQSIATVARLIAEYDHQLKFVVASPADVDEALEYVSRLRECEPRVECDRKKVLMMPMGTDRESLQAIDAWLVPRCEREGIGYSPRKQIEWYGFTRGT